MDVEVVLRKHAGSVGETGLEGRSVVHVRVFATDGELELFSAGELAGVTECMFNFNWRSAKLGIGEKKIFSRD